MIRGGIADLGISNFVYLENLIFHLTGEREFARNAILQVFSVLHYSWFTPFYNSIEATALRLRNRPPMTTS